MVHLFNSDNPINDSYWTKKKEFLLLCNVPPKLYQECIKLSKDPEFWKDHKNIKLMKKFISTDTLSHNLNKDPEFYNKDINIYHILVAAGFLPSYEEMMGKK